MIDDVWFVVPVLIVAFIAALYAFSVRNRFKTREHGIRAAAARIGATIDYARSIDRHTHGHSRQAQQHAQTMANKGHRRGRRWRPSFLVDFQPWPDARGVEVIIPSMQAGLGGRGQEYQTRLELIEAIRVYNQELDQIPSGTVAQHLWNFRHYSYRFGQVSNRNRHPNGGQRGGRRHHGRRNRKRRRP